MDRKAITVVVVVILCAGFAYSQGWFDWSLTDTETQSNTVSTSQAFDQEKKKADAAPVTQETAEPVATSTE